MVYNDFDSATLHEHDNLLMRYPRLAGMFSLFSLLFSASVIGLFINLLINAQYPITHFFFLIGIVVSLLAGVSINMFARMKAQRSMRAKLEALLKGIE